MSSAITFQKNAGPVRRFARLSRFAGWLQQLPNKLTPPPFRLLQIGSAFWQSRALYVAARLDLATRLGEETHSVDALAAATGCASDALYRLLRMLASLGVFAEVSPRHFSNNALSLPLQADRPGSVRAMILMHNAPEMSRPWFEQLEQGIRSGDTPFRLTHGSDLYDYMDNHPAFDALFAGAMDSVEALAGDSFARDFAWDRFDRLIDLGGSQGSKAIAILKQQPRLTALVIDRPQVIAGAAANQRASQLAPDIQARLSFQAGDLLAAIPAARDSRDIYLLSAVLHGMDDRQCLRVLGNVAQAIGDSGARLAVLEMVVAESKADAASAAFDMQMFMACRGRERTLSEWLSLFAEAGLELEEQVGLQSFAKLLLLRKARH